MSSREAHLRSPEDDLGDASVGLLHLEHGAHVGDGVGHIAVRPHNLVRPRVPQPLVRPILLQGGTVEVEGQIPLAPCTRASGQVLCLDVCVDVSA